MDKIKRIVEENYNLSIRNIRQTVGGWTSAAYIINTEMKEYFAKVYERQRSSVQSWINRMDKYMPVTFWLYENSLLKDKMAVPILTVNGAYKVETPDYVLVVFPLIKGTAMGETRLDRKQIHQLASALAELHSYDSYISIPTDLITEDYSLPFLSELSAMLDLRKMPEDLVEILKTYYSTIKGGIEILKEMARYLKNSNLHKVLCHTDLHGGNLMWDNNLILIDWEGMRLAPVEADLFIFTEGFFFDYASDEFMSEYKSIKKDYEENTEAMLFYCLRRRLEDISEFIHSAVYDQLSDQDLENTLRYLREECVKLSVLE